MTFPDGLDEILFFAGLTWVVGGTIYYVVKYRGFAAAGFGARIERTVGQFDLGNGMRVKVHKLGGAAPDREIGIEFVQSGLSILVIPLSVSKAQKLATLIQSVVGNERGTLG